MTPEVLSANPFSDKYVLQSAMFYDLTFDPRDDLVPDFEDLSDKGADWKTLSAAPTRSALFYDASYNHRDNRVFATEDPCENLSSAPTKSALLYNASYDPRAGKASLAREDNNLIAT
jgi:hypothetical protein